MLKSFGTEFKVGVFTLVALTTLGYMLFVLNPTVFQSEDRVNYHTILLDASGIIPKTHVKTNGVTVGKVKSVDLDINSTKITFEIDRNVKIPVGSKMEIRTRGLLGDVFLEIVRAADSGEYIQPNGLIKKSEDAVDMQSLIALVGAIGKDVKKITGTLANVIGSEKGEQDLEAIIDNIKTLTADLRKTGETVRTAFGDRPKEIHDIVTNIGALTADLRAFSHNLKDVLDDGNKERINRILASFDESMDNVKGASQNIKLISEKVEKGEGTLGKLINDDTALVEIQAAVKDIREVLSPATKLQVGIDYHGERRMDESTQHYFNIAFRTRPDRYYLLGLTDAHESTKEVTEETLPTSDPNSKSRREVTVEKRALRFNLQMAKRWYFFALRAGLFESTGGFATDFYLLRDRLRFSFEAFDFNRKTDEETRRLAHLKSYVSVLFFNHIYALVGVDDITRKLDPVTGEKPNKPNYFVGGGLSFNDQDLKALFGTAALAL